MKVVALVSGGKDSCYNMMQCVANGHEIVALANLRPSNSDEVDSYMYQTVGHHAIDLYSQAMGLPLYRRTIQGQAVEQGKNYVYNAEDEVEDLYELLKNVVSQTEVDAVSVGAVLSDYQRVRVENVCSRLGLSCLAYLWRRNQKELLAEMISCCVDAIIIKVAALGLDPQKHLGKRLAEIYPHLCELNKKFDCHICGEGGEYETFTLDCPLFQKKIVIDSSEVVIHSDDAFAPVGYLNLKEMHLEDKRGQLSEKAQSGIEVLKDIPLYRGDMTLIAAQEVNNLPIKIDPEDEIVASSLLDIFHCDYTINLEEKDHSEVMTKHSRGFAWISNIRGCHSAESIEDQTGMAMKQLERTLVDIGSNLENVILVHIYVKNMKDYAAINAVYAKYFDLNPPCRVCVQTSFLDSTIFQLDFLAIIPGNTEDHGISRLRCDAMHVQSISYWAPANIGPYSQAAKVDDNTGCVAGCIGLWPSSMTIISGGVHHEAPLALRHVTRILEAFIPGTTLADVISGVCYVTDPAYIDVTRAVWLNFCKMLPDTQNCADQANAMMYVVVPALPKGALVEWHVVSHHCPVPCKCKRSVDDFKNFKVSLTNFTCFCHMCGSVNASIGIQAPNKPDMSIREMVKHFIRSLDCFITSCGLNWNMLLILRVFFRTDVFKQTYNLLKRAFHDIVQESCCGKSPVIIFVPVLRVAKPSEFLSVNSWFQTPSTSEQAV